LHVRDLARTRKRALLESLSELPLTHRSVGPAELNGLPCDTVSESLTSNLPECAALISYDPVEHLIDPRHATEYMRRSAFEPFRTSRRLTDNGVAQMPTLRVISWNLAHRVGEGSSREAELVRALNPDLGLLQEANARSIEAFAQMAGFDWVRWTKRGQLPLRAGSGYLAAVAGRGPEPEWLSPQFDVPFPDRVTAARIRVGKTAIMAASYHAPPGVSWGLEKAQQAVSFAHWLSDQHDLVILGADANTPLVDHPDFARTLTHWQTGFVRLKGAPGDDLMWGHGKVHGLDDAFRVALANDPARLRAIREMNPNGPLEVSYRTRRRNGQASTPWRFDGIWISEGIRVASVDYLYDRGLAAGSDHAVVLAELLVPQVPLPQRMAPLADARQPSSDTAEHHVDFVSKPRATSQQPSQGLPRGGRRAAHRPLEVVNGGRGLTVYTRRRRPEGDWILIKNPKVYSSRANWATGETFNTEAAARDWAYHHGMTVSERQRWLNTQ